MAEGKREQQGDRQGGDQGGRESSLPASLPNLPAPSSENEHQGGTTRSRQTTPDTADSGDPEGARPPPSLPVPSSAPAAQRSPEVVEGRIPTQRRAERAVDDPVVLAQGARIVRAALERRALHRQREEAEREHRQQHDSESDG